MFLQIFACYMRLNMESQIRDFRYSAAIRTKELEKRIAHLEHLVGWLTGLLLPLESPPRSMSQVTAII